VQSLSLKPDSGCHFLGVKIESPGMMMTPFIMSGRAFSLGKSACYQGIDDSLYTTWLMSISISEMAYADE